MLQEIPPPPGQNGTRIRLNTTALAGGRSKAADFRSAVEAKTKRLAGLRTAQADTAAPAAGKTQGQATGVSVRKTGAAAAVKTTAQRSLEDALGDRKKTMKATAAPFKKEFNPTLLERGDRDLFAIALNAGSRLVGSVETLEIANSIGVRAYILGAGLLMKEISSRHGG